MFWSRERTKYEPVCIALFHRQYSVFQSLFLVHLMQSVLRFSDDTGWIKKTRSRNTRTWHNIGINNRINNSMVWRISPLLVFLRAPKYYTARENHHLVPRVFSLVERTLGTRLVKPSSKVYQKLLGVPTICCVGIYINDTERLIGLTP